MGERIFHLEHELNQAQDLINSLSAQMKKETQPMNGMGAAQTKIIESLVKENAQLQQQIKGLKEDHGQASEFFFGSKASEIIQDIYFSVPSQNNRMYGGPTSVED